MGACRAADRLRKPKAAARSIGALQTSHFLGTPVSGPQSGSLNPDAAKDALLVQLHLFTATHISTDGLLPMGASARLVLATGDRQPVLPTDELTAPVRWAAADSADRFANQFTSAPPDTAAKWKEATFAVPKGVTGSATITDGARQVQLFVRNTTDRTGAPGCELSIGMTDGQKQELASLPAQPVGDGLSLAAAIPFQFQSAQAKYIAAIFRVTAAQTKDPTFADAMQHCKADVQRESDAVDAHLKALLDSRLASGNWPGYESALKSAGDPKSRRAAMVYLATQTGAAFSRDVFLVADAQMLGQFLTQIAARIAALPPAGQSDTTMAWVLDFTCLEQMGKKLADNQLSPELEAVLTSYAGEAGRHPSSMDQIMRKLSGPSDLQTKLVAENMIFLEDSSPAARVRAYDWLNERKRAPAGFDPLGQPRDRRDAIEKALAPTTAP